MTDVSRTKPKLIQRRCILVCQYRSCLRQGAADVLAAFQRAVPVGVFASGSDCMGQCSSGPTVRVMPDQTWYCRIKPADVETIVDQHVQQNQPVAHLLHPRFRESVGGLSVAASPAERRSTESSSADSLPLNAPSIES